MFHSFVADESGIDERGIEAIEKIIKEKVIVKKPRKRTYKQRKILKTGKKDYIRSDYYIVLPSSKQEIEDELLLVLSYETFDRLLNIMDMYAIPSDVFSLILAELLSENC